MPEWIMEFLGNVGSDYVSHILVLYLIPHASRLVVIARAQIASRMSGYTARFQGQAKRNWEEWRTAPRRAKASFTLWASMLSFWWMLETLGRQADPLFEIGVVVPFMLALAACVVLESYRGIRRVTGRRTRNGV